MKRTHIVLFLAMDKSRAWIAQGDRYMGKSIRAVYASEPPVPDVSLAEPMVYGISESRSTTRAAQASSSFGYLGNIFNVYGCRVKGSEQECFIDDYCVWYNGIDTATSCNGWNYVGKKGHEFNCPVTHSSSSSHILGLPLIPLLSQFPLAGQILSCYREQHQDNIQKVATLAPRIITYSLDSKGDDFILGGFPVKDYLSLSPWEG